MTSLARGDRIVDPDDPSAIAVIIDGPVVVTGTRFYVVLTAKQEEITLPEADIKRWKSNLENPASWLVDRPLVDPDALSRALTHLKLTTALTDIIYSLSSARTLFRPHQFKPVLKMIESPVHRMLLADEVGLGKTVEAGLIWTELDARAPLRRVLIVVPPGLVVKWQMEMERRFDREVVHLSSRDLLDFTERYLERGDEARLVGVISYSQLRNPLLIDALTTQPPTFDLAIFDEAHAMRNAETRTHEAGALIAQNSDSLLFLSATPVNLGANDLYNLLHLLRPDEFSSPALFAAQLEPNAAINTAIRLLNASFPPDSPAVLAALKGAQLTHVSAYGANPIYQHLVRQLEEGLATRADVVGAQEDLAHLHTLAGVYTRTRKRELRDQQVVRRAHHLNVALSAQEAELYRLTVRLVAEMRRRASGAPPGLAMVMPARQASSCLPVMRGYIDDLVEKHSISLELDDNDELDDVDREWPSELFVDRLPALADDVREAWQQLDGIDSKFEVFVEALRGLEADGTRRQVLLFSFFRRTLSYLEVRLVELGYRCAQMTGGTLMRDRNELQQRFRAGEFDLLLCSEIGSEGLDFEFCDVLVNYDLPWNPMRLEQRIGRLDRFGQRQPVIHIFNFAIDGTIDTDIFFRLYQRIRIFEHSIGDLEPILGATVREITRALVSLDLTHGEQQALADRLALAIETEQRHLNRFSESQDQLMSADAFVEDALRDAREGRRYLTPDELSRYVAGFLRDQARPARLEPLSLGTYALYGSPLLADRLRELTRRVMTPAVSELITTLETGGPVSAVFDAELAYDSTAMFVTHQHPLVRAIAEHYRHTEEPLHPGGYVRFPAESVDQAGRWAFYVFLLSASGLLPSRTLVAIAARLNDRHVDSDLGERIMSWLSGPEVERMEQRTIPIVERDQVTACYELVLEHVVAERETTRARLQERNAALVATRQDSLRRELAVRKPRLEELARNATNPRIERMRLAQIRNTENDIAARIAALDDLRDTSVGFRVVLGGIADVVTS